MDSSMKERSTLEKPTHRLHELHLPWPSPTKRPSNEHTMQQDIHIKKEIKREFLMELALLKKMHSLCVEVQKRVCLSKEEV